MYEFFRSLGQHILNGVLAGIKWIASVLVCLWNAFKEFMGDFFEIIILVFKGFWYLIESIFSIVVLVIQVVLGLFKLVLAVVSGIFQTFYNLLTFSGSTSHYQLPSAYQQGFNSVTGFFGTTGFNTIAAIALVFVWIVTAFAVIKIAGGER